MGARLAASDEVARSTFEEADEALGCAISVLCFEGPEDELRRTENAQPAILATSVATYRALEARSGVRPALVAGHSLGEWSALVAAESLDLGEALRAVRERGRLMQAAVPEGIGAMAAVMGLEDDVVAALCDEVGAGEVLAPANLNGASQVVVAGVAAAVERLIAAAKAAGGKAQRLAVSAPFHCALMSGAEAALGPVIDGLAIRPPRSPLASTVEPRVTDAPEEIRDLLKRQVTAPVRWAETMRVMLDRRPALVLECGPGRVLRGLLRRADRTLDVRGVGDPESLAEAVEAIG